MPSRTSLGWLSWQRGYIPLAEDVNHTINLSDMNSKYADVISSQEAKECLSALEPRDQEDN